MERFAPEIGRALRRARQARGLTLHQLADASGGRFKATSVAGYERGERSITVERFCALCLFYELNPGEVLSDIVREVERRAEPEIALAAVESLGPEQGLLVSSFIRQIRALRRAHDEGTIAVRTGDLEVLATASGRELDELLNVLRPVADQD
jgi:transcriptional regulator with XRE-family HTH domain